jgi:hypothetical protein
MMTKPQDNLTPSSQCAVLTLRDSITYNNDRDRRDK